jgi:hypothetical protein
VLACAAVYVGIVVHDAALADGGLHETLTEPARQAHLSICSRLANAPEDPAADEWPAGAARA